MVFALSFIPTVLDSRQKGAGEGRRNPYIIKGYFPVAQMIGIGYYIQFCQGNTVSEKKKTLVRAA